PPEIIFINVTSPLMSALLLLLSLKAPSVRYDSPNRRYRWNHGRRLILIRESRPACKLTEQPWCGCISAYKPIADTPAGPDVLSTINFQQNQSPVGMISARSTIKMTVRCGARVRC